MRTREFTLRRARALPNAGGYTLYFVSEGGDRRHPPHFFQPDEVPEFEGESALFECVWRDGRWRVAHRIDEKF